MTFTERETRYLTSQSLGRLATVRPDGAPQNSPVTFWFDAATGTIDIGGPALSRSQKYRNVQAQPEVSFVVDDLIPAGEPSGPGGQRGRGLEIRGRAELLTVDRPLLDGFSAEVIRIRPRRIISWNVDAPGSFFRNAAAEVDGRQPNHV